MSGGAKPYRVGAEFERYVKRAYESAGWPVVVRSPKSGSPMDLTCIRSHDTLGVTPEVQLVQVKKAGYMNPEDRRILIELARQAAAEPILAWGKPVRRKNIRTGVELDGLS